MLGWQHRKFDEPELKNKQLNTFYGAGNTRIDHIYAPFHSIGSRNVYTETVPISRGKNDENKDHRMLKTSLTFTTGTTTSKKAESESIHEYFRKVDGYIDSKDGRGT